MPEPRLAVEEVSVRFGSAGTRVVAVDRVSLAFWPGTVTQIMGPSGSGKTTLLAVLGALLRPDEGRVFWSGRDITDLSEEERTTLRRDKIGFIFQAFRLLHALPAIENVLISRDVRGPRRRGDRERAVLVLNELGLGSKLDLKPAELSGGEKQRVAIARALLDDPGVLLADEPTASLDSKAGTQILELLRNLSDKRHYTTVVVSHDPRWTRYVDRIVILEDGRVIDERNGRK